MPATEAGAAAETRPAILLWKGKQRWDGGRNENRKHAGCECRSPVSAEVRRRRHGHCGWRSQGVGWGGSVRLPVLAHPALPISCLPACLLKNAQIHCIPRLQLKPSSVKPDREQLRLNTSPCLRFLPHRSRCLCVNALQTFGNTDN